jgi:gamma-glutamylcyclotransferase (GGCT)/AIG2-like uncharacterized protein YtfP
MSTTPLGHSLLRALECKPETVDECLQGVAEEYTSLSMEKLSGVSYDVVTSIVANITAIEGSPIENIETILASPVRTIFCYGTLRADMTPEGDQWGVIAGIRSRGVDCVWHYGRLRNYALHQNKELFYPFATQSSSGCSIFGTLLSWPANDETFAQALLQCNSIEGYDPEGGGLYMRAIVTVETESAGNVLAYVYYQEDNHNGDDDNFLHFPEGDWLQNREKGR